MNALTPLAELFIAIAGFSGIIVALSGSSIASDPLDRFRVVALLFVALGGAFFAALPLVLNDAGVPVTRTWVLASGTYAVYLGLYVTWLTRQRYRLPIAALNSLHPVMWIFAFGGNAIAASLLFANAIGWPFETSAAFYLYSLLYGLLFSCVQFVRLLIVRPGTPPAA